MFRCRYCHSTRFYKVMIMPFQAFGVYHCLRCNAHAQFKDLLEPCSEEEFKKGGELRA